MAIESNPTHSVSVESPIGDPVPHETASYSRRQKHTLDERSEPRAVWMSPVFLSLIIGAGAIFSAALISDQTYRSLWQTPKSITFETLLLFGSGVLALAFGALIVISSLPRERRSAGQWPALNDRSVAALGTTSTVLTFLTLTGYAAFALAIARSGVSTAAVFSGDPDVKFAIGTIPGVTTLTQFGIAAVVVSSLILVQKFSLVELSKMLIVIGFAVMRAFVNSERLALIELVVPVSLVLAAKLASQPGRLRRVAQFLPIAFTALVVAVFSASEYFRSWTFYRAQGANSYTEFALNRLAGYYATALNNGHLNLVHDTSQMRLPYGTLVGLWTAPGIQDSSLYQKLSGQTSGFTQGASSSRYSTMLQQFGNPEFNSESGYSGPFVDYGTIGGIVFFLLAGMLLGLLYRGFCRGMTYGLLLYPVAFIGLLELPRYMYWSYGRVVPAWLALAIVVYLISRTRRQLGPNGYT